VLQQAKGSAHSAALLQHSVSSTVSVPNTDSHVWLMTWDPDVNYGKFSIRNNRAWQRGCLQMTILKHEEKNIACLFYTKTNFKGG
jgi:hypothetical protein